MKCNEARMLAEDALDGTLSDGARHNFERHVQECAVCRAFLESEKAEFDRWRSALKEGVRRRALPADFADRLVRAVEDDAAKRRAFWSFGRVSAMKIAAALAVLLGFAAIVFNAVGDDSDEPMTAHNAPAAEATDVWSRCERMTKMLEREVSRKAATQYLASVCSACSI